MSADDLTLGKYEECWLDVTPAEGGGYLSSIKLSDGRDYGEPTPINLDDVNANLTELILEPEDYGKLLFSTFVTGRAAEGLALARDGDGKRPVRIRLRLPPTAARLLHTLRWEWLYDERGQIALAASPDFALSRLLQTANAAGAPVATRPLRVLVVISNPSNLSDLGLDSLNTQDERQRIEAALVKVSGQVDYTFLDGPATVQNIRDCLERGKFHVLHVLAHGHFKDKGYLILEDDTGKYARVDESNFGDVLLGQEQLRLVVLAACLTSFMSPARAFAGLAPALVMRGVPAVVAMQGHIEITAAQAFVEYFYRHLSRNGVVDAAVNYARYRLYLDSQYRGLGQWGLPVLFMNTENGQLYFPAVTELGAGLPEDLKNRFLPLLREFVNREDQSLQFRRLATVEDVERILFVRGIQGMGKTWFVHRCIVWCVENNVAQRELDFQMNPGRPWDYLVALDMLIGGLEERFQDYRTLVGQKTAGGRERAFERDNQAAITESFIRCLAAQPPPGRIAFFVDHLSDSPQDVRDWVWGVLLPLLQGRRYPLDHVTIVVTSRVAQPELEKDKARWLHVVEETELKPLTLEYFLEFARKRNITGRSEEQLAAAFEGWAVDAEAENRSVDEVFTPYALSLRLTLLERRARQGQGVR